MAERAKKLIYQGTEGVRAGDFFAFAPAQDLGEAEIALLSDEEYATLVSAHPTLGPLYVDPASREPAPPASGTPEAELSEKSVEELRELAKERGVEGRSRMDKDALIAALAAPETE